MNFPKFIVLQKKYSICYIRPRPVLETLYLLFLLVLDIFLFFPLSRHSLVSPVSGHFLCSPVSRHFLFSPDSRHFSEVKKCLEIG